MKLFGEKVEHTFTNSPHNILECKDYNEIFFDVYEIELNNGKYPVEKVSVYGGNPVVMVPIIVEGEEKEYPFILMRGEENIIFNEDNISVPVDEEDSELFKEGVDADRLEETRREILEQISKAKKDALFHAEQIKRQKIQEARKEITSKKKALDDMVSSARESLVNEFLNISKKIKGEFISENDNRWEEIQETINNKIEDISSSLSESLKQDFSTSEKQFDGKIRELVKELYKSLQPKIDNDLKDIAKEIVEKVNSIETGLDNKFQKSIDNIRENVTDVTLEMNEKIGRVKSEISQKVEKIDKNVNKSLSRVGSLDKKVDKVIHTISEEIDYKLKETEDQISKSWNDKLKLLEDKNLDINDKNRKYLIDLITESKHGLIEEVRKISKQAPIEYVVEANNTKKNINQDDIIKDLEKKINFLVSDVETRLRKYVSAYGGGGGTVATQYQDGGTMNGNLNVTGAYLSAGVNLLDIFSSNGGLTNPIETIDFDTAYTSTGNEPVGSMYWNSTEGTVELVHDGATQEIGQELYIKVRNTTGSTIPNGTPVYFDGRAGNRPRIHPAIANSHATSVVMGITTEDIDDNSDGYVTSFGYVRQIKTNYSGSGDWGDTWNEGDNLYVSKAIPGQLTNVEPSAPHHSDVVGQVGVIGGAGIGSIFVNIRHHFTLEEASDVNGTALSTTGQIPVWNSSLSAFDFDYNIRNYVPYDGATTDVNLGSNSLSANTLTLSGQSFAPLGSASAPSYTFTGDPNTGMWSPAADTLAWSTGGGERMSLSSNGNLTVNTNTFVVDSVNNRVGIGTTTPLAKLHVEDSSLATVRIGAGTRRINLNSYASDWNYQTSNGAPYVFGTADNNQLLFYQNNQERMRIQTGGNVGIGTTTPSARLHTVSTTEQLRLGYDDSNYMSATVSSAGLVTLDAVGSGAGFVFGDKVAANGQGSSKDLVANDVITSELHRSNLLFEGLRYIPYAPTAQSAGGNFSAGNWGSINVDAGATTFRRMNLSQNVFLYAGTGGTTRFDHNFRISVTGTFYIALPSVVEQRIYVGSNGSFTLPFAGLNAYPANTRGYGFKVRQNPLTANQLQVAVFARDGTAAAAGTYIESAWVNFGVNSGSLALTQSFVLEKIGTTVNLYGTDTRDTSTAFGSRTRTPSTVIATISGTGVPNDFAFVNTNWSTVEAVIIGDGSTANTTNLQNLLIRSGFMEIF